MRNIKPLMVSVVWKCEKCDVQVIFRHEYGESLYVPEPLNWCSDADGGHIFCDKHLKEWERAVEAANPGVPWMA
jgi:hypothetical protein